MATRRHPQWLHAAVQALLLFSATEAVTLSQFQQISADQIPSNCLSVYTSAIAGCVEVDFATGASCSAKCAQGITAKELNLQNFCAGIQVNPKSLLGIALGGTLLGLLCPLPIATSTPPVATSPSPIVTSTKIPGFTTIPFPIVTTKDPTDTPPATTIITTTDPKVTSKPLSPPPASTPPPPPATTDVQTPTLVPPPSSSDSSDTETSTTAPTQSSTDSLVPPSTTNIGAPPAVVDPPEGNNQAPQPIEQNGSPFADINFSGAGKSICAPPTTMMVWLSLAVGLILRAL